jgi:hypothetical protein
MRAYVILGVVFVLVSGCGSAKFAPVSGRVTLNGKPLPNAFVTFNPTPKAGSVEAGPSAIGTTDEDGRYTLRVSSTQPGALVGMNRVAITVVSSRAGADAAPGERRGHRTAGAIPSRYNDQSKLTCDVPPGGTDQANFALESP